MRKDILYLLNTDFMDNDEGPYFCPGCAQVIGLLTLYPALKEKVDIRHVDFPRPRPEIIALIGEENQSCPVLILHEDLSDPPAHLKIQQAKGRSFVEGPDEIAQYFAHRWGTPIPH